MFRNVAMTTGLSITSSFIVFCLMDHSTANASFFSSVLAGNNADGLFYKHSLFQHIVMRKAIRKVIFFFAKNLVFR